MKRKLQKSIAMLLAVVMVLCLLPAAALAASPEEDTELPQMTAHGFGYIPVSHPTGKTVTNAYLSGDRETYDRLTGSTKDTLPSKYDSREKNIVTSVKNQNPYGSCWAHAAMASIESYMIYHNVPVGSGSAATTSLNLSESQHCWFNYTYAYDAAGMLTGDKSTPDDFCLNQGGNGEMSAYTLMRWTGAADESTSALHYANAAAVNTSGLDSKYAYQYDVCHVQNCEWIPGSDIEGIKRAIMKYGAGNISYFAGDETTYTYTYQCTIDTSSQQSDNHKWANHSITVIGWDDSIEASNFSPDKPSGSGAWLCKNSCGTGYFDSGYMYISYEDTSVLEDTIYFMDAEPIDNYQHNYQYDGTCNIANYGKGWDSTEEGFIALANNTQVANVFTANGYETLRAVALCSWNEGLSYTLEVYKNPTAGNPSSGTKVATQSGLLTYSGYYTIPLETPVQLAAGDTFSVVFKQSVSDAEPAIYTPYDASFSNEDYISWCSWTHANHGATSFYKEPGGAWTDCPDNGDYRIKAYTDDTVFTVAAESNNTAWGTVAVDGYTITATPAQGYYAAGYEVVSGTATATINVNTITVTPTSDCTIRVIFAPKVSCTVNFVASGTAEGSQSALINDYITLPTSISVDAEGWSFAGWSKNRFAETEEKPDFYAPGASYQVTGNTTLYAVFVKTTDAPDKIYELVTEDLSDWTGKYVISSGNDVKLFVLKGVSGAIQLEDANSNSCITYTNSGMTLDGTTLRSVASDYVFTVAKNGTTYTIKSPTGYWLGANDGYLYNLASYSANYADWSISYDTSASCMKIANVSCTSYPYLVKGNSNYFKLYSNYITKKTYLWKETSEGVTTYYTDPIGGFHVHTPEYVAAVAPTCATAGHSAYYYCPGCEKYFSDEACEHEITLESTVIPATGNHSYGAWASNNNGTHKHVCSVCGAVESAACVYGTVVTPPTCTEAGYTTYTCTVCAYSYQGNPVAALGHDYQASVTPPTCTAGGYTTHTCSRCNNSYQDSQTDPLGHDFGAWSVTTQPSCTTEGEESRSCSRCQLVETRPVDALGHDWDDGVVTKEATEDEDGERLYTCNRCQTTRTEVIPRLSQTNPFVDVTEGKYYYNAVLWAYYHNPRITSGTDATHFSPSAPCTREQIVFFLWAAAGKPAPTTTDMPFSDVKASKYYYEAVLWAKENGITNGISASLFGVGKYCSREQVVTFLWRACGSVEPEGTNPFTDVPANAYYEKAVRWAVENGVTGGTSPTTFSPKKLCTRAEVVTFLYASREKLS